MQSAHLNSLFLFSKINNKSGYDDGNLFTVLEDDIWVSYKNIKELRSNINHNSSFFRFKSF